MARGTSILEFAVENFPNNTSHPLPPEDHFLWETARGALQARSRWTRSSCLTKAS